MTFERYDESLLTTIHNTCTVHGYYRLLLNMASLRLPYEKNDPKFNAQICEKILASLQKNADPLITDGRYQNALHYLLAYGTREQILSVFNIIPPAILATMCTPNLLGITPLDLLIKRMEVLENKNLQAWDTIKKSILDLTFSSGKNQETSHRKTTYACVVKELQEDSFVIYISLWPTQKNLLRAREIIQKVFQNQQGFSVEILEHNSETLPENWDSTLNEKNLIEEDLRGKEIKISIARILSPLVCKNILLTLWRTLERNGLDIGYIKPLDNTIEEYPCAQNILSPFTSSETLPAEFSFTVSDMLVQDLLYFHEKSLLKMRIYLTSSHATHISGPLAYFSKYLKRKRPEWSFAVEEGLLDAIETGLKPTMKKDNDFNAQFIKKLSIFIDAPAWQISLGKNIVTIFDALKLKQEFYRKASSNEERKKILHEICFYLNALASLWEKLDEHQKQSLHTFLSNLTKLLNGISSQRETNNEKLFLKSNTNIDKNILKETYLKHIHSMRSKTLLGIADISDTLKNAIALLRENPDIDPAIRRRNSNNILHFIMIYNHTTLLNDLASSITSSYLHKLMAQKNEYDDTPLAIAHRKGDIPSLLCALQLVFLSKKAFDKNIHGVTLLERTLSSILILYKNERMKINSFNKTVIERAKVRDLKLSSAELTLTEIEKKLESIINTFPVTHIHNPTLNGLLLGLQGAGTLFSHPDNTSQHRPWHLLFLVVNLLVKTGLLKGSSTRQLILILEDCERFLSWAKDAFGFNEHRELQGKLRQGFWNIMSETPCSSKYFGDTTSGQYVENFVRVCQFEQERLQNDLECNSQEFAYSHPLSKSLQHG